MTGCEGDDELYGNGGDDQLAGGAGNDRLEGGTGTDTAIFTGNLRNYTVTVLSAWETRITDNRPGSPDGTDVIYSDIERLRFADGEVARAGFQAGRDVRSDFNADGRSDVAWLHDSFAFTTWTARSDGSFANQGGGANPLDGGWRIVGIGDFNGDGNDDLLWRHHSGELAEWQGQNSGGFVNLSGFAANAVDRSWTIVGTADYNGDGRDDILWSHFSGAVAQWLGQSNGVFTNNGSVAPNPVDFFWRVVANGDFDGDGYADVLWQHKPGVFVEWRGTASGAFFNAGTVLAGVTDQVIGSGDFNGDGRSDVLTRSWSGAITEWLGQAGRDFTPLSPAMQIADLSWDVVAIGDYNGDGFDDLLWRHSSGELGEWLGSATGQFTNNAIVPASVDSSWHVQSPDIFLF